MIELKRATDPSWVDVAMSDVDAFLLDHASCERKASATGLSLVCRYPDRQEMIDPLIAFAREELEHFHRVVRLVIARGLQLLPDTKDVYVGHLQSWARKHGDARLLDQLLVCGVIEARGCERFALLAQALPEGELKTLYDELWRAEAKHHTLFLRLAKLYFAADELESRLESLLQHEADVIKTLPARAALH